MALVFVALVSLRIVKSVQSILTKDHIAMYGDTLIGYRGCKFMYFVLGILRRFLVGW